MSGPRRFDPSELTGAVDDPFGDAEVARTLATARDLEEFARAQSITPSVGFEDRVMAAIATEAPPRTVVTGGLPTGLLTAVRDAWRITWSGGRPLAVRAQALALVLLVALAVGSVGTLAAVGAVRLLSGDPSPSPVADPSPSPSPSPSPAPTPSPQPSPSPSEVASPSPTQTPEATESAEPTDDLSSGTATIRPTGTAGSGSDDDHTAEPDETPEPDETLKPGETPDASDD